MWARVYMVIVSLQHRGQPSAANRAASSRVQGIARVHSRHHSWKSTVVFGPIAPVLGVVVLAPGPPVYPAGRRPQVETRTADWSDTGPAKRASAIPSAEISASSPLIQRVA